MDLTSANLELIVLKADMGDMGQSVETMQSLLADISRVEKAAEEDESEVSITCSQNNVTLKVSCCRLQHLMLQ